MAHSLHRRTLRTRRSSTMWFSSWLRSQTTGSPLWREGHLRRAVHRRPRAYRLSVETLENRCLLSTFAVLNANDDGAGSLRQAILDANANPGADLIGFNIPGAGIQTIAV